MRNYKSAKACFKGPEPTLPYAPNAFDCVAFVCGGTGAAPAVQLLRAALADKEDTTRFRVLYLSRTKRDQTLARPHAQMR